MPVAVNSAGRLRGTTIPRLTVLPQFAAIPEMWETSANAEFDPGDAVEACVDEVVAELGCDRGIPVEGVVAVAEVLVDGDHRATVAMMSDLRQASGSPGRTRLTP